MYPEIYLGPLGPIPTYVLYLSLLYCGLLFYVIKRAYKKSSTDKDISAEVALNLAMTIMVGGFIGARLLHVFYENWSYYAEDPYRIFQIWYGGFVYYGGLIGAALVSFIYMRKKKLAPGRWFDFYAPVLALGYGLGRVSCVLAGCCYGRYCELPWALRFPFDNVPRHPTQVYAILWELGLFAILIFLERKNQFVKKTAGALFLIWLIGHSMGRMLMEYFRDDFRGSEILGLSVSSWISLMLLSLSLSVLLYLAEHKKGHRK